MDLHILYVMVLSVLYHAQCVVGQCDVATRPLALTASSQAQYFTSPNYPADYPANSDCEWIVTAPGLDDKVIVNIEEFFTEATNDQLLVYDGIGFSETLIATMDNTNRNTFNVLVSSEREMRFAFTSDGTTEFVGFQILYFSNDSSTQYACGDTIQVSASTQVLMSPNLPEPYLGSQSCYWSFQASDLILFSIKMLDMQCGADAQLSMYNGNGTANLLDRICETSQVYEFDDQLTTMTTAYINWIVYDDATDYFGFLLTYRLTGPENIHTTCNETGYNITAVIYPKYDQLESPNFGGDNDYPSNTDCQWFITAPENYSVEISFDQAVYGIEYNYYCSWDYLIIYDGHNTTTDRQLNRVCGIYVPGYSYRSTDRYMLLIFSSDYALNYNGFRLIVTAKLNTYPGCIDNYDEYSVTYNTKYDYYHYNESYINNLSTPSYYYDYYYGYTKYANNLELFWLLTNDNTTYYTMVIELRDVNIESAYDCLYDKLIIYDGPCIADGVYDHICGYWEKRWDLTGPEYLLHFHSDNSFNYGGFLLDYYAEENILTPPPTSPRTTTNGPPVEAVVNAIKDVLVNYSSENFPVKNISLAITASLDFFLVGINGIDEVEQKLTTTGQFEVTWHDESMSWDPTKRQGIVKMLLPQNDLWKPDIALMNGFSKITAMGSSFMFIDVDYDGSCLWKPYQIMESVCKVDLTHYPYDRQTCVLKFGTWGTDDNEVVTELGALGLQIHPSFQDHAEWRLISHRTAQEDKNNHKIVEFFLTLERNPQYVSYYMTLPIVMLAYLNVFTFIVPTESGEKTGFSITIFLSFVVLLIITNSSMPENSDSISLYAAYLLILTVLSAIGLIICVLQVKALTLTLKEWRYPRYSYLAKTVRAIKKLRSFKLCRSEKSEDTKSISESTVNESDKEKLLGDVDDDDDDSEHSFGKGKLKKKRSVAFVDDEISLSGEKTPEGLLGNDKPNNRMFDRDTTLFMEYADVRQPTQSVFKLGSTESKTLDKQDDDDSRSSNSRKDTSEDDTDTDSADTDDDQLPESNIMQVESVKEDNRPSRPTSKTHTRTVSFRGGADEILTPTAIERSITVHNSKEVDVDVAENADIDQTRVQGSTEALQDKETQHTSNQANDTNANVPNNNNTNSVSSSAVERTKSTVSIQSHKDQLPQSREPTGDFETNGTFGDKQTPNNVSDDATSEEIGSLEPQKHLTGETNTDRYEMEPNGISSNSGIAVDKQLTQSSQSSLRKNEDDTNLNEAVLEGDNTGPGSLVDSVSIKQTSEAVEYRMKRPSSVISSRSNTAEPNTIGTMQSEASFRPISSGITFTDQRPISRQSRLSSNNSHDVIQGSPDKRPLSRSLSKDGQSSENQQQPRVDQSSRPLSSGITFADQRPTSRQSCLSSNNSPDKRPLSRSLSRGDDGRLSVNEQPLVGDCSRPPYNAVTVEDQIPISRQPSFTSNNSHEVDKESSDKRSLSRSLSRRDDDQSSVNQQPLVGHSSRPAGSALMFKDQTPESHQQPLLSNDSHVVDPVIPDKRPPSSRPPSTSIPLDDQIPNSRQLSFTSTNYHTVDQSSRPLSSAITFKDQRPISRQMGLSSNYSTSPDKRPFSRSLSRCNDVNQQPVSRMSQRIGIGLMGNQLDTQRLINGVDNTETLNNDYDVEDAHEDNDSTSVKSVQDNESVSTITTIEEDEDEITWSDVVSSSDFICFVVFMVITTMLTLALFMTMITAF